MARPRGRPRAFDMDEALDGAIGVFREHGYHATSIPDLADAMGLTAGSIYKAFKDKRAVFLAAYDRYAAQRQLRLRAAAAPGASGRGKIRDVLTYYVENSHDAEGRRGCLVVGSAVELAPFDPEIGERVTATMARNETLLAELIALGQADGSIASTIDRDATARLLLCLTQGMRVAGKTGRGRAEMAAIVDVAMKLLA